MTMFRGKPTRAKGTPIAAAASRLHLTSKSDRPSKLSALNTVTMIVASLFLLAALGFLSFLWLHPPDSEASDPWHCIVTNNWALRSVTLTALAIRTAASTQAVITTSMLACIILERYGIALHASAPISAFRFVNNGPYDLLLALRGSLAHARIPTALTFMLLCTAFLLQFSSTALLADFGNGVLASLTQQNATLAAMSINNLDLSSVRSVEGIGYWMDDPPNFPTFAERERPPHRNATPDSVRDTGESLRAFLPFSNASIRAFIKQFDGMATVLDSRVTCVRPKLHAGLAVGVSEENGWLLNGTLVPEVPPIGLILTDEPAVTADLQNISYSLGKDRKQTTSQINLSWAQQIPFAHDAGEWNIIQKLMYLGPALVSSLDPRYPSIAAGDELNYTQNNTYNTADGVSYFRGKESIPLMTGRSYQLLNATLSKNVPELVNASSTSKNFFFHPDKDSNRLTITSQNEWLVFTLPQVPGWRVSVTLCYDSFTTIDAKISVQANQSTTEPSLTAWDVSKQVFSSTDSVRRQLGASGSTNLTLDDREIMYLRTTPAELRDQVQAWYDKSKVAGETNISFPSQNFVAPSSRYKYAFGTLLCGKCGIQYLNDTINKIVFQPSGILHQQIFQDVLRSTADSALASQAFYTSIGRLAYYDMLSYFDLSDNPTMSLFQSAQFPRSVRGLSAVVTVVCIHLILVALVTAAFLTTTTVSRVGDNAWQSMVQAQLPWMEGLLRVSTMMKDGDYKKRFAEAGMGQGRFLLQQWDESGEEKIGLSMHEA